jgi:hypothetical protein
VGTTHGCIFKQIFDSIYRYLSFYNVHNWTQSKNEKPLIAIVHWSVWRVIYTISVTASLALGPSDRCADNWTRQHWCNWPGPGVSRIYIDLIGILHAFHINMIKEINVRIYTIATHCLHKQIPPGSPVCASATSANFTHAHQRYFHHQR